jgi:hypothetical protein
MIEAAALLFIIIFGLVIVLWPVIGRLVVLALALVLISALIQMLKADELQHRCGFSDDDNFLSHHSICTEKRFSGEPAYSEPSPAPSDVDYSSRAVICTEKLRRELCVAKHDLEEGGWVIAWDREALESDTVHATAMLFARIQACVNHFND